MARIAGVDLPPSKQVWVGLTYIYGIGRTRSRKILETAEVEATVKVKDLTEEEARRIRQVIQDEGRVEGDLRKEVGQNIRRLIEIGSYREFVIEGIFPCEDRERTPMRVPERGRSVEPSRARSRSRNRN